MATRRNRTTAVTLVEHLVASPCDPDHDRMIDSRRRPDSQAGFGIEHRDPRLPGSVIAVGDLEDRPHAPPHPRWVGRPAVWPQAIGPFDRRVAATPPPDAVRIRAAGSWACPASRRSTPSLKTGVIHGVRSGQILAFIRFLCSGDLLSLSCYFLGA